MYTFCTFLKRNPHIILFYGIFIILNLYISRSVSSRFYWIINQILSLSERLSCRTRRSFLWNMFTIDILQIYESIVKKKIVCKKVCTINTSSVHFNASTRLIRFTTRTVLYTNPRCVACGAENAIVLCVSLYFLRFFTSLDLTRSTAL